MTRAEHLLVIAMEECAEVIQRLSKALRFGLDEVQPEQPLDNRERIRYEFSHLCAAMEMVDPSSPSGGHIFPPDGKAMDEKREQVERFLAYSADCGTLQEPSASTKDHP